MPTAKSAANTARCTTKGRPIRLKFETNAAFGRPEAALAFYELKARTSAAGPQSPPSATGGLRFIFGQEPGSTKEDRTIQACCPDGINFHSPQQDTVETSQSPENPPSRPGDLLGVWTRPVASATAGMAVAAPAVIGGALVGAVVVGGAGVVAKFTNS